MPIPIEVVLVPFMIANRDRLWITAMFVTAGCLAASVLGYGIGYFLFEALGGRILGGMGWEQGYLEFQRLFARHGFFAILLVGVVPVPFQTAMLAAGATKYPIWKFILAATIARSIRYYGLAALVAVFGEKTQAVWEKHTKPATAAVAIIIAAIWWLARWGSF